MPTLKLTGGKPATRTTRTRPASVSKPAPTRSATKAKPTRSKPAAKVTAARKPAKVAEAKTNGAQTRGPKVPDGWSQRDFDKLVRQMEDTLNDKLAADAALKEAQEAVNQMALDAIAEGIQMSVVSDTLNLSRQWLYTLMEKEGVQTARQVEKPHPNKGLTQDQIDAKSARAAKKTTARKPASKRTAPKAAAKRTPTRSKPSAKKTTGRRTAPGRKPAPARGRVRITA